MLARPQPTRFSPLALELRAMIAHRMSDLDAIAAEKACTTGFVHRCLACVRARGGHFEHRLHARVFFFWSRSTRLETRTKESDRSASFSLCVRIPQAPAWTSAALVVDNDSGMCKAGFAGDDGTSRCAFRCQAWYHPRGNNYSFDALQAYCFGINIKL